MMSALGASKDIIIGDRFPSLFQAVANNVRSPKGDWRSRKVQLSNLCPSPVGQPGYAALILGGGEAGPGMIKQVCLNLHRVVVSLLNAIIA